MKTNFYKLLINQKKKKELSPKQEAYAQFFMDTLQQFQTNSPSKLNKQQKSQFFNQIKKGWKKVKKEKFNQSQQEKSPKQKAFAQMFFNLLDQFKIKSPNELDDQKKSQFFDKVKTNWKKIKKQKF